jgi:hypothetical protein
MRQPRIILKHTIDIYRPVFAADAGAKTPTSWTLLYEDVPCNVQDTLSELVDLYKQRDNKRRPTAYITDADVYRALVVSDRVVFGGVNYRIVKLEDLCNRGKVMRLDLEEEVS